VNAILAIEDQRFYDHNGVDVVRVAGAALNNLREGLVLVAVGLIVGGVGSLLLRRTLETQLFGVTASNPIVLLLVSAVLAVVALVACAVPARRATRIDPLIVLTE
jgi:ABC-type antimicrobial peptide transport system permease subunit